MKKEMQDVWDKAAANPGQAIPVGRHVVCDMCDGDWTDRPESGGFQFCSYAYCPDCAPRGLAVIASHNEERYIVAKCEKGESFGDFVRRMRGPDSYIRVSAL